MEAAKESKRYINIAQNGKRLPSKTEASRRLNQFYADVHAEHQKNGTVSEPFLSVSDFTYRRLNGLDPKKD